MPTSVQGTSTSFLPRGSELVADAREVKHLGVDTYE